MDIKIIKRIFLLFLATIAISYHTAAQTYTFQQTKVLPSITSFKNFTKGDCPEKDKEGNKSCAYTFDLNDEHENKKSFYGTYTDITQSKSYMKKYPGNAMRAITAIGKFELKDGLILMGYYYENTYSYSKDLQIIFTAKEYTFKDGTICKNTSYSSRESYDWYFTNGDRLEQMEKTSYSSAEIKYTFANGDQISTLNFENNIPKNGSGFFTPKDKPKIYGTFTLVKEGLIEFSADKEDFKKQFSFNDANKCISGNCLDGFGKKQYANGNTYEGDFKNAEPLKGKLTIKNGDVFEGEFLNGKYHGQGKLSAKDDKGRAYTYTGNFAYGNFYGKGNYKGTLIYADGEQYEGEFADHKFNGQGTLTAKDYQKTYTYVGNFKDGGFFGIGTQTYTNGTVYKSDKWEKTNGFSAGFKTEGGKTVYGKRSDDFFIEEKQPVVADEMTARLNKAFGLTPANTSNNAVNQKTYVFQSTCASGKNKFTVISKISANPAKHSFEEVQQLALKSITQNAWQIQSELKYLGYAEDVKLSGTPGRDYSVSENSFNDF